MNYKKYVKVVKNFPKLGVEYFDITTLLQNGKVFLNVIEDIEKFAIKNNTDVIVAPESRGFIFGCPVAAKLKLPFIPARKPGKLPREVICSEVITEYSRTQIAIHKDSIKKGQKVLIIDDILATGGTIQSTIKLVEELEGIVVGCVFLLAISELNGKDLIKDYKIKILCE